jgi:ketosteroid isomerase-like protein
MQRAFSAVAVLLMFACMNFGQTKPSTGQNAVQDVTALEKAWLDAARQYDVSWFERNIADTFTITDERGVLTDKATMISDVKSKASKFESISYESLKVQGYGDTAIARGIYVQKGTYKGKDNSGQYSFTDTWVKLAGRWQCVAEHVSKVVSK